MRRYMINVSSIFIDLLVLVGLDICYRDFFPRVKWVAYEAEAASPAIIPAKISATHNCHT